jgi:hypothetical protein
MRKRSLVSSIAFMDTDRGEKEGINVARLGHAAEIDIDKM